MMVALFGVSEGFTNIQSLFVNTTLLFAFVSCATDINSNLNLGSGGAGKYTKEFPVCIFALPMCVLKKFSPFAV